MRVSVFCPKCAEPTTPKHFVVGTQSLIAGKGWVTCPDCNYRFEVAPYLYKNIKEESNK